MRLVLPSPLCASEVFVTGSMGFGNLCLLLWADRVSMAYKIRYLGSEEIKALSLVPQRSVAISVW
jgi:hypothetical protein